MENMPARIILLAGPTASGKSALALRWAREIGARVINADSMQVYSGLRVLTARPSQAEEMEAEHALYGHVDAADAYSVGRWLADIAPILKDGRPVVVVGGTGLYFEALVHGIAQMPDIPAEVRQRWRARGETEPAGALHAVLAARDPVMAARLRPSDRQRVLRALEVLEGTGRSLAEWQDAPAEPLLREEETARFVLAPPRDWLRARIAERFAVMMKQGALDEVRALAARGLDPSLPAMRALGMKPLNDHLAGKLELDAAVERAVTETRQFAKRQETWFRNRFSAWARLDPRTDNANAIAEYNRA